MEDSARDKGEGVSGGLRLHNRSSQKSPEPAVSADGENEPRLPIGSRVDQFFKDLEPGLITGCADDDPSGISTYAIAGAAFGYATLWTALISFPLMAGVQMMCSRLGMVTGRGLASVIRRNSLRWILWHRSRADARQRGGREGERLPDVAAEPADVRSNIGSKENKGSGPERGGDSLWAERICTMRLNQIGPHRKGGDSDGRSHTWRI